MNRFIIIVLSVFDLVACGGREGKPVAENKEAKTLLQGIWVDAESEQEAKNEVFNEYWGIDRLELIRTQKL